MLTIYPFETLGQADYGWLKARYHFSFARYRNPSRTGFGTLLVINDDIVQANSGFDTHAHDNMEIITYVRQGAISHQDSLGNKGRTQAGDVQVMSAGTGVEHSEYNHEVIDTKLYQIWILPNKNNVTPRWECQEFPNKPVTNMLPLLVSGRDEHRDKSALYIHQDAAIFGGKILTEAQIIQPIKYQAYILVSAGSVMINNMMLNQGDGAEAINETILTIKALTDCEILVIDVPPYGI